MGTTWHLSYLDPPPGLTPEQVRQGLVEQLALVDGSMSTFRTDSEISRFNASAAQTWFDVSAVFLHVLAAALDVGQRSDGAFDITVAPLVDLWGFGPAGAVVEPPAESDIASALTRVGQGRLLLDSEHSRIKKLVDLSLDVSSLAEGYAVDRMAQWLLEQHVTRFMVELGGELRLSGLSGRDDPWRIAIEQPDDAAGAAAATLQLTDVAVSTSGDYHKYFEANGRRYSHLIDPRTGSPVAHDLVSVTVVHPDCMLADAWSTALTILSADAAMSVARTQGLAVYFIRRIDGGFVHSHTPQFAPFLVDATP
jgi:thiamine biosynthesis lipoprotein